MCSRTRFRPELALTRLDLADLMLSHFPRERAEALRHLDFATAELSAMHMQPAIERALRLGRSVGASTSVDRLLTAREREVAALVTHGLSNREIANQLVITEGTAEVHVKHILSKLGLKSRHQIGAWAATSTGPELPV